MSKQFFQRWIPDHQVVRDHKHLRIFGALLHDPNLFHLNRRSVAGACAVGLFCAFLPIPFQMVVAAALAIAVRVNLPISVALVWITNPITMPPIFYFAYLVGTWVMQTPPNPALDGEFTLSSIGHGLADAWAPFLIGCLLCGLLFGAISYAFVRLLWRLHIVKRFRQRRLLTPRRDDHPPAAIPDPLPQQSADRGSPPTGRSPTPD
jgi:uncharacterized protein (DUF2062 family)